MWNFFLKEVMFFVTIHCWAINVNQIADYLNLSTSLGFSINMSVSELTLINFVKLYIYIKINNGTNAVTCGS